jgi:hypothetical protein
MTGHQKQALEIATKLGADQREIEAAIRLMRTGRSDLILQVCAARLSIRAALRRAKSDSPRTPSRAR